MNEVSEHPHEGYGRAEGEDVERAWESRPVRWSAGSGLLLAVGFVAGVLGAPDTVETGVYIASTVAGARFFGTEAAAELVRERRVGIELLMTVAAVVAGALGEWGEAATLAFLYSISEALEEFTEDRTRNAIRKLLDLAPKRVTRLRGDGTEEEVDLNQIAVDDRFLVRPGQNVPTDGVVEDGNSVVNEAAVTGESVPVEKSPGGRVFAGTANAQGALVVRATATFRDNTLAKVVQLVTEAHEEKGRGQQFMERFSGRYSPIVLAGALLIAVAGGAVSGSWSVWLLRAATVLVAAAPCALVISIPVTYVAAIGNASRKGVLIKGGIYLEELGQLRVVALDKTGTLTIGAPQLVSIHPTDRLKADEALAIAAGIEARSEHPLARAVVAAASTRQLAPRMAEDFESTTGAGAQAALNGRTYVIGSPAFVAGRGIALDGLSDTVARLEAEGNTVVVLADEHRPLAALAIADTVREQAGAAVADLRVGVEEVVMLTGDNPRTARAIAREVGVDEVVAGLSPQGKAETVRGLIERFGHVAMVGDGINDAPALAAASVGIAMGTAGSDIAIETADVALMADDLSKLTAAVRIGARTRQVVRQNLILSLAVLAVLIPGALVGWLALPIAVLGHELSELAVIINGTRMARG